MPSRRGLAAVGVLAVAARLVYVLLADPAVPFTSDAHTYHLLARNIADGNGYLAPYDWFFRGVERPTAEFGPVHPALLALPSLVGVDTIRGHQLYLAVLGSVTPVLVALLAARVLGRPVAALAAGALAAVHPMLFGSDGAIMSETTYTLLGLVAVLALLHERTVLAGVAIGLAILTRGDGLLLLPLVAVPIVVLQRTDVARRVALVVALAALVVTPWVVRNAVRFDGDVVLSNNLGSLLNGSNCPATYDGERLGSWDFGCAYDAELPGTDEAQNSKVLRAHGLRYLREHAERLPVVVPARLGRAWGLFHPFGQARAEEHDARVFATQAAGTVLDWVLLPLALLGCWKLRRAGPALAAVAGPLVLVTLVVAGSYGNSRFRELAEPALIVGAVAGVVLDRSKVNVVN